jgi:hypothetical protein
MIVFFTVPTWNIDKTNNDLNYDFQYDDNLTPDHLKERD